MIRLCEPPDAVPRRIGTHPAARIILMSIRPRFVEQILAGTKTVELRRRPPAAPPGSVVYLYASSPVMELRATARVMTTIRQERDEFWATHRDRTSITRNEFFEYFDGMETAAGLELTDVRRARVPVPLQQLRTFGLQPPQSWRYLDPGVADQFDSIMFDAPALSLAETAQAGAHALSTVTRPMLDFALNAVAGPLGLMQRSAPDTDVSA